MPKTSQSALESDVLLPWQQQPGESSQSFAAFAVYRDLGPDRSLRTVAQKCIKSVSLILRWSSAHNWPKRVRAYDAHLDTLRRGAAEKLQQEELASYRERAKKSAGAFGALGQGAAQKAAQRLITLDAEKMTVTELVKLMRAAQLVMDTSLNAEAEAIGVRELENMLDQGKTLTHTPSGDAEDDE